MNERDEWETPNDLFTYLTANKHFDIDLCATADNNKCKKWASSILTVPEDWLKGDRCAFMNPPFSNIGPFIKKAWELSLYCEVVVLVPSSIKSCKYMDFLDELNGTGFVRIWKSGVKWSDLSRRTKFIHPRRRASTPSFGCSVLLLKRSEEQI